MSEHTCARATNGDVVLVKARPNYQAVVEHDNWGRLTVRPLPGQQASTRARAIWRRAILEVISIATTPPVHDATHGAQAQRTGDDEGEAPEAAGGACVGVGGKSRPFAETVAERWKRDPEFRAAMEEAEAPCAVCGGVILCGGCPSEHPECPSFDDHKALS